MLTIHLLSQGRMHTAVCNEHAYAHPKKDPIPPLCRKLIGLGYPEDTLVEVRRGTVPVFKTRSLSAWAEFDIVDSDDLGLRKRRYQEYPKDGFAV